MSKITKKISMKPKTNWYWLMEMMPYAKALAIIDGKGDEFGYSPKGLRRFRKWLKKKVKQGETE